MLLYFFNKKSSFIAKNWASAKKLILLDEVLVVNLTVRQYASIVSTLSLFFTVSSIFLPLYRHQIRLFNTVISEKVCSNRNALPTPPLLHPPTPETRPSFLPRKRSYQCDAWCCRFRIFAQLGYLTVSRNEKVKLGCFFYVGGCWEKKELSGEIKYENEQCYTFYNIDYLFMD